MNYTSKNEKVHSINVGIQYFKAKGKITSKSPFIVANNVMMINNKIFEHTLHDNVCFKPEIDY